MRNCSNKGFTILELIVAIFMASIVISTVYFTWNYIDKHIETQKRKAELSFEINWVSQQIMSQIKRSSVLSWDEHEIILETEKDSIHYKFDTELSKNGNPFQLVYKGIRITDFRFEEVENNDPEALYTMLEMKMTVENAFKDTAGVALIFEIKKPDEKEKLGNDNWNF